MFLLRLSLLLVLTTLPFEVRADLSSKQARKLITRMAGIELPSSAVRIKSISSTTDSAEATAEIRAIFRLTTNEGGMWQVAEVRVAPERWEDLGPVAALYNESSSSDCNGPQMRTVPVTEPSNKRARCLIAAVLGVHLPSDAVRIKSISPLEVPLSTRPSAVVESSITVEFRFSRDGGSWAVAGLRTGDHDWVKPEVLMASANETKATQARGELDAIARALVAFRTERQSYVASDSHAVLIDFLSPRFLSRVLRLDPWHQPYQYRGERDSFTLRSFGPDRKENTDDDIVVSSPR